MEAEATKVVIAGAGFAGTEAAQALSALVRGRNVQITMVSDRSYHLFTPLLYQVASGLANSYHVIQPVRGWAVRKRIAFLEATVNAVDIQRKAIETDRGVLNYDFLVLCLGTETNDFGIPGVSEKALFLKKLEDGDAIRNRMLRCFEAASLPATPESERRRLLSTVIVGGGSSGVELAGTIADYFGVLDEYYKGIDTDRSTRVSLIEAEGKLVPGRGDSISETCLRVLRRKGVDVRFNAKVASVDADGIRLRDVTIITTDTVVWDRRHKTEQGHCRPVRGWKRKQGRKTGCRQAA